MKRVALLGLMLIFVVGAFANPFVNASKPSWDLSADASEIVTAMTAGISTASDVLMGVLPYAIGIFALFLGIRIAKRVIKTVARG